MDNNELIMEVVRTLGDSYKSLFDEIKSLKETRATREGQLMILGKVDEMLKVQQQLLDIMSRWNLECHTLCQSHDGKLSQLLKFEDYLRVITQWDKLWKALTGAKAISAYVLALVCMGAGAFKYLGELFALFHK